MTKRNKRRVPNRQSEQVAERVCTHSDIDWTTPFRSEDLPDGHTVHTIRCHRCRAVVRQSRVTPHYV